MIIDTSVMVNDQFCCMATKELTTIVNNKPDVLPSFFVVISWRSYEMTMQISLEQQPKASSKPSK
jgi:hypothetical protein